MRFFLYPYFLSIFIIASFFAIGADQSVSSVNFIDDGGVVYNFPASALNVNPVVTNLVTFKDGLMIFRRNAKDYPICIASTPQIFVGHDSGHVIVIPEFKSEWLGAISPRTRSDLITAGFGLDFGYKKKIMYLTTDLYTKRWIAEHDDGSNFYIGDLEQSDIGTTSEATKHMPVIAVMEKVQEGEELSACLAYITAGTEFRLRAIKIIVYPIQKEI